MIFYIAGGASVAALKGREREMVKIMPKWNRLVSYHYLHWIKISQILKIIEEQQNENKQST